MSKVHYGAAVWGGAPGYLVKKVKSLQLEASRIAIGPKSTRLSTKALLN